MKTLIVYDSVFGNTQKLAEAMAVTPDSRAVHVSKVSAQDIREAESLLVGSPTRAFKPTPGITEWLKSIPDGTLKVLERQPLIHGYLQTRSNLAPSNS